MDLEDISDKEIAVELLSQTLRNRVRAIMYGSAGRTEQALAQRKPPSMIEIRRMEMADAQRIIDLVAADKSARIRLGLLEWMGTGGPSNLFSRSELLAALDGICPEDQETTSPSTTSST